ncbi:hypothetical protein J4573_03420 [Actinomadura barringtoniae]|uniref:Uncharacterized protein n=1 Tax=Actinomadura barringtoniae TaxID=1427535 RepID=A0A939T7R0_9ACTN|nr:hypothetical protein [Actinomadura barringtoniae]MBO2446125.1 hypothetical protein [Actinomadura barringtoniae]
MSRSRQTIERLGVVVFEPLKVLPDQGAPKMWPVESLDLMALVFGKLGPDQAALKGIVIKRVSELEEKKQPTPKPKPGQTWHTAAFFETSINVTTITVADLAKEWDVAHECGHAVATYGARAAYARLTAKFEEATKAAELQREAHAAYKAANEKHIQAAEAAKALQEEIEKADKAGSPTGPLGERLKKALSEMTACGEQATARKTVFDQREAVHKAAKAAHIQATADHKRVAGTTMTARVANFFAFVLKEKTGTGLSDYATQTWPDKPEEFYCEAYAAWITDPERLRKFSVALYAWFRDGNYRNDTQPTPS